MTEKLETKPTDKVLEMIEKLDRRLTNLEQAKEPHKTENNGARHPRRHNTKPNGRCFKCGEMGHWAKDCHIQGWVSKDGAQQSPKEANTPDGPSKDPSN